MITMGGILAKEPISEENARVFTIVLVKCKSN